MMYGYRCRVCGATADSSRRTDSLGPCPDCSSGELRRCYRGVQLAPVMQEHYNPAVNGPVSSAKQVAEELKRQSDKYSERTGIESRFVPVDPGDAGGTNDGLEATNRVRHARGEPEVWLE